MEPQDRSEETAGARFGRYRIVRRIGHGAFGTVYEALLPGPGGHAKRVALKKLRASVLEREPTFARSMVNEARIGALLHHPNVIEVLEAGHVGRHYFLAMAFVDGADLGQIVTLCRERGVVLPRFAVLELARQICRGLHHAHELKNADGEPLDLVHRDLKPSNILVGREGVARIADFGVARSTSNLFTTTLSGVIKGTPRFMSPEQVSGEGMLSRRSDLFSFGGMLFEMAVGRHLFDAPTLPSMAHAILHDDLEPRLDEAEEAIAGCRPILERLLRRDPQVRYSSARAVEDDLGTLSRDFPPDSDLATVIDRLMPRIDRSGSVPILDTAALAKDLKQADAPPKPGDEAEPGRDGSTVACAPVAVSWDRFEAAFEASTRPEDVGQGLAGAPSGPAARTTGRSTLAIVLAVGVIVLAVLLGWVLGC